MKYPDGEYTFNVAVSLDEFEAIWDLFDAALRQYNPTNLRALANRWAPIAGLQRDEELVDIGSLDPNLLLSLVREWIRGVRDVPLPLPVRSSDGDTSADPSPEPSSDTSSGTPSSDDGPDTPLRL